MLFSFIFQKDRTSPTSLLLTCLLSCSSFTFSAQAAVWPFSKTTPVEVMNTISSFQRYGNRAGFHHGLDLAAPAGQPVYAPVSGIVEARYYYPPHPNDYTFEISITQENGLRWELHHVDKSTIPQAILKMAENKEWISESTYLGNVFDASVYHLPSHVHFNLLKGKTYLSPLAYLPAVSDAKAPQATRFFLQTDDSQAHLVDTQKVLDLAHGQKLIIEAFDTMDSSTYQLPVFSMMVKLNNQTILERNFLELPYEDFLQGADEVYLASTLSLPNGEVLEQATQGKAIKNLYIVQLPTSAEIDEEGKVEIQLKDFSGNQSIYHFDYKFQKK